MDYQRSAERCKLLDEEIREKYQFSNRKSFANITTKRWNIKTWLSLLNKKIPFPWDLLIGFIIQTVPGYRLNLIVIKNTA